MNDYLTFDKFITPLIIQILFWIGVAGYVLLGLYMIVQGAGLQGLLLLLFGPLFWRIMTELMLVSFKILEALQDIRRQGDSRP
jgi:hypothetical protein